MKKKALITAPCHTVLIEGLRSLKFEVDYLPNTTNEQLQSMIKDYSGIVIATKIPITQKLIQSSHQLEWIARLGSGIDHIDTDALKDKNILLLSSPEGNAPSVGEHTLALLLSALRCVHTSAIQIKESIWDREKNRGSSLHARKIGIIGYGHTGKAFAKFLLALGIDIYVHDKFISIPHSKHIIPVSLIEIQKQCDVISLHINYTKENHHFANQDFFSRLQPHTIFINTSRGANVDSIALLDALDKKQMAYACLDVLENEHISQLEGKDKYIFERLSHHENILLTCHIAGVTDESFYLMSEVLLEKIRRLEKI